MARTWVAIQVDLIEGHGEHLWPRPADLCCGTDAQLCPAGLTRHRRCLCPLGSVFISTEFPASDGTRLTTPYDDWDDDWERVLRWMIAGRGSARLKPGEQFVYVFDFEMMRGWAHLCTVGPERIDPLTTLGIETRWPAAVLGWGDIPDQYQRRWNGGRRRIP